MREWERRLKKSKGLVRVAGRIVEEGLENLYSSRKIDFSPSYMKRLFESKQLRNKLKRTKRKEFL
jgi:hypothetical protein